MKKIFRYIWRCLRTLSESFALEAKGIWHDQGVILFFLFLPLVYPVIYSLIYNPEIVREVEVVVVDNDRTPLSRDLVRRFDATQGAKVIGYAANLEEAKRAMHEHKAFAILEVPDHFESDVANNLGATVPMYCDMSLLLRYRALLFSATDLQLAMGAEIQAKSIAALGVESLASSSDPAPIESGSLGNLESGFDSFIMPGVLMLILQQCIVLAVGMMGGRRWEEARMGVMPFNSVGGPVVLTLIGRATCYIVILAVPLLWLAHFVPVVFRFPMMGDMLEIFAFLLPLVLASISLGFIIQCFTTERESIFLIWVATSVFFLFLSGLTWPRYAFSEGWTLISDLIPATWGVNGFIVMNANGASLSDVWGDYTSLWILTAFYFAIAWALHRFWLRPHLSRLAHRSAPLAPA